MSNPFVFIDESGVSDSAENRQPYFVVGFLKINNPDRLVKELNDAHTAFSSGANAERKRVFHELTESARPVSAQEINLLMRSTRHHEYHFTDINLINVVKYQIFIDILFKYDFHFCALVIDRNDLNFDERIYGDYWKAYITYTRLLCKYNCRDDEKCTILADFMNKPREHSLDFAVELLKLPNIHNVLRCGSIGMPLIQLVDILTGAVAFSWRELGGYTNISKRAEAKQTFLDHLSSRLGIKDRKLIAGKMTLNSGGKYFSVWPLKLKAKTA